MNNALNGTRRALRLGTGLVTCVTSLIVAQAGFGQAINQLPTGGMVVVPTVPANQATIALNNPDPLAATRLTVDAAGNNQVINWNSFNIGSANSVSFVSTNGAGVALSNAVTVVNRVVMPNPSTILGSITSGNSGNNNISVWLVNPSGVTFGAGGAFNGGSLVVSTLDFRPGENGSSAFTTNSKRLVANTGAAPVGLVFEGTGGVFSKGSVMLLGEQIDAGKVIAASGGDVTIIAGSDVSFTPTGSPISYRIYAGTRVTGASIVARSQITGANVVLATANFDTTQRTLLQVDSGSQLIATADNGGIVLSATNNPTGAAVEGNADIIANGALRTSGLDGSVSVTASGYVTAASVTAKGNVTARAGVEAGENLTLGQIISGGDVIATAQGNVILGTDGAQAISAKGSVRITSTDGAVLRGTDSTAFAIGSNTDGNNAEGLTISAKGDAALGNASLTGSFNRTSAVTITSTDGAITLGSASSAKFTAIAKTTFTATGAITADNGATAGNAVFISANDGITLATTRAFGTDQDIRLVTGGPVTASSISAARNITIGDVAKPASSINVTTLNAAAGSLTVVADAINFGTANALQNVSLRSDGAINASTSVIAGNGVFVSGVASTYAGEFVAPIVTAGVDRVSANAGKIDLGVVRSGTGTVLQSLAAGIAVGSVFSGTTIALTSTAGGDILLGKAGAGQIVAKGTVSVNSAGEISRGPDSTSLTIRSNDDDTGAENLALKAQGAVDLGSAILAGGRASTSAISVESVSAEVVIGAASAARFTGKAGTTFTASKAITADGPAAVTGTTIGITAPGGITLATARTGGTGDDIVLTTAGAVVADTLTARRNLTIGTLAAPVASIKATTLTATTGALNAFAGAGSSMVKSVDVGNATAATTLTLRSDGDIAVTGTAKAGTNLTVAGVTAVAARSFSAETAEATAGTIDVKAGATDVGLATSGLDTKVDGSTVIGSTAVLGRIVSGRDLIVTTRNDITLGKAANQTVAAKGRVMLTSSAGAIRRGIGATNLTLTSNSDGIGTEALTLNAGTAIALDSATLNGGTAEGRSAVSLTSGTVTTFANANSAAFTAAAGGAFTSTGAILAAGNAAITAGGLASIARVETSGAAHSITISAASADIGTATSAANYRVTTTAGDISLGRAANQVQAATGLVSLTSTGAIGRGASATNLTLTSNSDGIGTEALTLNAGTVIALAGATLNGGTAEGRSPVSLTSGTDTTFANANSAAFTAAAGGAFTSTGAVLAAGNAAITAGGAVSLASLEANGTDRDVTITTPGAVTATTLKAARNLTVGGGTTAFTATTVTATAGTIDIGAGATDIGTAASGLDTKIAGTTAVLGTVTAGRDYVVSTTGDLTLGKAANQVQQAAGVVMLRSAAGAIKRGANATNLTLTSNSNGMGTEALTLNAGTAIALDSATLNGGTAEGRSAVSLTSGTDTTFANANSADFTAAAGGGFTSTGAILAAGNAAITAGGAVSLASLEATGTNRDVTITTPGAVTATTLRAARNVTVGGGATAFTATTVAATTGTINVSAGATDIGTATSGMDTLVTGTTAALGTVTAGRNYIVTTTGDLTLGKAVNQVQQAAGAVTLRSTAGSIKRGATATNLTVTSNSDGLPAVGMGPEALTLNAGTAITLDGATLNGGTAEGRSAMSLTSGTATTIDKANSAAFTSMAGTTFTATGAVIAAGNAALTAGGTVSLLSLEATGTDRDVTITTPGAVTATTLKAARNVTVGGGTTAFTATTVTATAGTIDIGAGATDIGTAASGLDTKIAGTTAVLGTVTAGRDYVVTTTGDLTLGKAANQVQQAAGLVTLTSTAGAIKRGANATNLTLTSNSNGMGTEALTLNAGTAIALDGATLNGGTPTGRSAVSLTSGTDTTFANANSAAFTATSGRAFTATGPVAAAGDILINAAGAVTGTSLSAARNVTIAGLGGGSAASLTATTVTATGGAIDVKAGATDIGAATSLLNTKVTGTTATLGTVTAGGNYTVDATGHITLGKAASQLQQAKGGVALTSSAGSIVQGATGLVLTSNSDGVGTEALTLNAKQAVALGGATLNGGSAQQSAVSLTSGTDTVIGKANGASLAANAIAGSFTANGEISSKTTASIVASNAVTLGSGGTVTDLLTIQSSDATIGRVVKARTIDIVNTGTGNLVIGNFATGSHPGFVLNRTEISNLQASGTLTLGAGTAAPRNVEIGSVAFTTPSTVRVGAAGRRIDITGRVSFGGATRTLKLGGDVATGTGLASIIQIAATGGGSIQGGTGALELGADNIVVGNTAFINGLKGPADALSYTLNPASPLYNGSMDDANLIQAGSMRINFTGYALFQNTSSNTLLSQGVTLGTNSPTAIALDIISSSQRPVFAMFGSINGVVNNATALLGNPPLQRYENVVSSRINGCVIGGGNCQSVQNLTPSISGLENVRNAIFFVKPDFQVPFDPLVGTNNDALFDDVGSFGLGDIVMPPIECSEPDGTCETNKDAK